MVLTYSLFVCAFIVLLSLVINRFAFSLFSNFVSDSFDQQCRGMAASIADQYSPETGKFDVAALRAIAVNHARQGFTVIVENSDGAILFDGRRQRENSMGGSGMGMHMRMMGRGRSGYMMHDTDNDRYRKLVFPMTHSGEDIGRVLVETENVFFFDENQTAFISSLRSFLLWTGAVFALLSVLITVFIADTLSRPIMRAANAAMRIAKGEWSTRIPEKQRTREIGDLSGSLNHLAAVLEDGERRQKQLTIDVAHELRTPLAALQGNMEAMMDGVLETSPQRLAGCHEEILRLSRLVEDLGRLSTLEDKPALSFSSFDLCRLLRGVVEQAKPAAVEKGVLVSLSAKETIIFADEDRLKQVFVNILSNAVKYTDKGSIEVSLNCTADGCTVSVADTGIGIPEDELSRVFERFFRSDKSRSRATGGAGIGLAIAQAIVAAHGGKIEAASKIGQGSVFSVFLPKTNAEN